MRKEPSPLGFCGVPATYSSTARRDRPRSGPVNTRTGGARTTASESKKQKNADFSRGIFIQFRRVAATENSPAAFHVTACRDAYAQAGVLERPFAPRPAAKFRSSRHFPRRARREMATIGLCRQATTSQFVDRKFLSKKTAQGGGRAEQFARLNSLLSIPSMTAVEKPGVSIAQALSARWRSTKSAAVAELPKLRRFLAHSAMSAALPPWFAECDGTRYGISFGHLVKNFPPETYEDGAQSDRANRTTGGVAC